MGMLYNKKKEKKARREVETIKLTREAYEDRESIRQRIGELSHDESLRIRFIRELPHPAYRVSILKRYKAPRSVKMKDGRTVILQPGLYVKKQWWLEKTPDGFMTIPALPERITEDA